MYAASSPESSGNDKVASMDNSKSGRSSPGLPGGTWKSERLTVLELWVGPKRRLNEERSAVLPEPFAPIKAVMSWSNSTVTGQSPKHRKLRNVMDLIFNSNLRRAFRLFGLFSQTADIRRKATIYPCSRVGKTWGWLPGGIARPTKQAWGFSKARHQNIPSRIPLLRTSSLPGMNLHFSRIWRNPTPSGPATKPNGTASAASTVNLTPRPAFRRGAVGCQHCPYFHDTIHP